MRSILLTVAALAALSGTRVDAQVGSNGTQPKESKPGPEMRDASVRQVLVFAPSHYRYGDAEAVISRAPGRDDVLYVPSESPSADVVNIALDQLAAIRAIEGEEPQRAALYRVSTKGLQPRPDRGFSQLVASYLPRAERTSVDGHPGVGVKITPGRAKISVKKQDK